MKRYLVKMEFFVWADSDREALSIAESKAKKECDYHDNRANIVDVVKKPFGSIAYGESVYNLIEG